MASERDVVRVTRRLEMAAKYGDTRAPQASHPLAIAPTSEELREALSAFGDPVRRLRDELLWLWIEDEADEGRAALAAGDFERAERVWGSRDDVDAMHDLAVLLHARALDAIADGSTSELRRDAAARIERACTLWSHVIESDGFETEIERRIRRIDDPRIPSNAADDVLERLPAALANSFKTFVTHAAERNDADELGPLMRASEALGATDASSLGAAETFVRRIEAIVSDRYSADFQPEHGAAYCRMLLFECLGLLRIVDAMLPAQHPGRQHAHDIVARAATLYGTAFGHGTRQWRFAFALIEIAEKIAVGRLAKYMIEAELDEVRPLAEKAIDWYWDGYLDVSDDLFARLEGVREIFMRESAEAALRSLVQERLSGENPPVELDRVLAHLAVLRARNVAGRAVDELEDGDEATRVIVGRRESKDHAKSSGLFGSLHVEEGKCECCGVRAASGPAIDIDGVPARLCRKCLRKRQAGLTRASREFASVAREAMGYVEIASSVWDEDGQAAAVRQRIQTLGDTLGVDVTPDASAKIKLGMLPRAELERIAAADRWLAVGEARKALARIDPAWRQRNWMRARLRLGAFATAGVVVLAVVTVLLNAVMYASGNSSGGYWLFKAGLLSKERVITALAADAQASYKSTRLTAIEYLACFPAATNPEVVPPLEEGLKSFDTDTRAASAAALGATMSKSSAPLLVLRLADAADPVRRAAENALTRIDPAWEQSPYFEALLPELEKGIEASGENSLPPYTIKTIARLGPRSRGVVPHLVRVITSTNFLNRSAAFEALNRIDKDWPTAAHEEPMLNTLARCLEYRDEATQIFTLNALRQMGVKADVLKAHVAMSYVYGNVKVQGAAMNALEQIDPEWEASQAISEIVPDVEEALFGTDANTRVAARTLLTRMGRMKTPNSTTKNTFSQSSR